MRCTRAEVCQPWGTEVLILLAGPRGILLRQCQWVGGAEGLAAQNRASLTACPFELHLHYYSGKVGLSPFPDT